MREILFRGKRTDNGKWAEGFPIIYSNGICVICNEFVRNENVISETVGQYTGLTDKNGKKIFEGDIVSQTYYLNDSVGVVTRNGKVKFKHSAFGIYEKGCHWSIEADQKHREIVGNIHDNPELLEEEE